MGHVPPNWSDLSPNTEPLQKDFPLMSQRRKIFSLYWAKKAERLSPYTEPMQKDIPLGANAE